MRPFLPNPLSTLAVTLAMALALAAPAARADGPTRTLSVTGAGEARVTADIATISVGVTNTDSEASSALTANSAQMKRIFDQLAAEGVAERDMQTSQFSLNPVWENYDGSSQARITGYQVYNLLTIRVRQVEKLGALLDRLTREGANQINGISFEIADPAAAKEDARRAAMADAKRRATLYAEAAGVKLGRVLTIVESGGDYVSPGPMFRAYAEAAPAVPVASGEATINAAVSVTYTIE